MVWLTLVDFHSPVVGMMPDLTNSTLSMKNATILCFPSDILLGDNNLPSKDFEFTFVFLFFASTVNKCQLN